MTNLTVKPLPNASRAGRAIGAMFLLAFGGAWLAFGLREAVASPTIDFIAVAVLTVVFLVFAYRVYRANAPALRESADRPSARRRNRLFHWINFGQWFLILVAANILAYFGLSRWIVPSIIGIVGLHFLPLAGVFGYRPHFVTGLVLILLATCYPLMMPSGPLSSFGPLGAGVVLWLSAVWALASPAA